MLANDIEVLTQLQELRWYERNFKPQHSPLAGDVIPGLHHLSQYLPTVHYDMRWKNDDMLVESHQLDNRGFQPRYVHDKRYEAISIVTRLPLEIRRIIYWNISHTWSSFAPFPETYCRRSKSNVVMARRNKTPCFGPSIDIHRAVHPYVTLCGLPKCTNNFAFEQKYGSMDYYKQDEWEGVVAAVTAMEQYRMWLPKADVSKGARVKNLVEDFMAWFWEAVVMDVRYTEAAWSHASKENVIGKKTLSRFTFSDRMLHSRIRHISIAATLEDTASNWLKNWKRSPFIEHRVRGPNSFIKQLKFVATHLPNLISASIFIPILLDAIRQIRVHRKGKSPERGFRNMIPWVRTLNKLPINQLYLGIFVTPGDKNYDKCCLNDVCAGISDVNHNVHKGVTKHISLPHRDQWQGEEYYGLPDLFEEIGVGIDVELPATADTSNTTDGLLFEMDPQVKSKWKVKTTSLIA